MQINAIKCKKCNDIIYSRCRHDFHWCSCRNVAIDGGFDYMKINFKEPDSYESIQLDLNVTKTDLYNDWNKSKNKYGLIKNGEKDLKESKK